MAAKKRKKRSYSRKGVPVKSEKVLRALNKHNSRTKQLNKLAGEINTIIGSKEYADHFKPRNFYHRLLKKFRQTPGNHRFVLLNQLKGMEINEINPLQKLGFFTTTVKKIKNSIEVSLQEITHPQDVLRDATAYYYDVILLFWEKSKQPAQHAMQGTHWMNIEDSKLHLFNFVFENTGDTTHWLLCLHQILGNNGKREETMKAEGMQILNVGSFDKKELALLKVEEEAAKPKPVVKEKMKEVKRVGPVN